MSKTDHSKSPSLLDAPMESDECFLRRLEYEDPIRKASVWLRKLIVHRIRDVEAVGSWYRGQSAVPSVPLVSELLGQEDGRFCNRFTYYCRIVKKYRQGSVPRQIVADDHHAVRILLSSLANLVDDTEVIRLLDRRIREFVLLVTMREEGGLPREDYLEKIDALADSIVTICGRVSDQFRRVEEIRRGNRAESATARNVAQIVKGEAEETRRCVRKTARKAVKEIRTNAQSEYDRRGPLSSVRRTQIRSVVARMKEFAADREKLPAPLRGKDPGKWIHQACRDVWSATAGGYPDMEKLYGYCHRNEASILSLAGL